MKEKITGALGDPETLENLYRSDPLLFASEFPAATENSDNELVRFWRIRLQSEPVKPKPGASGKEMLTASVIIAIMILALRLPSLFPGVVIEEYYLRFLPVIILSGLTAWFSIKNHLSGTGKILTLALPVFVLTVFLAFLPDLTSDTTGLSLIHAPLFLGFVLGLAWLDVRWKKAAAVSEFVRFIGELVIMTGLILIAFFILSGMTISLFAMLDMEISRFYLENIAVAGLAASPVLAAMLMDIYPEITARIPPVIARIFAPLVLISALAYLTAMAFSGIDIRENREFLIIFNLLLLGVMAIIVFSLSVQNKSVISKFQLIILFLLSAVTLFIDIFALQAISSRLGAGFTPNRTTVLVSNLVILVNLVLIIPPLFRAGFRGKSSWAAEKMIYQYLPVYLIYTIFIIFVFPLIFGFR